MEKDYNLNSILVKPNSSPPSRKGSSWARDKMIKNKEEENDNRKMIESTIDTLSQNIRFYEKFSKTLYGESLLTLGLFFSLERNNSCPIIGLPLTSTWDCTYKCNLNCIHCYANLHCIKDKEKDEMDTDRAKEMIDKLGNAGVKSIAFLGGEPTCREDLFEIGSYALSKSIGTAISTNGTLITEDYAKELKHSIEYVQISIDGAEKTHDFIRGAGSYEKTMAGLNNCLSEDILTSVNMTAMNLNYKEIPIVYNMCSDMGIFFTIINYVPTNGRYEFDLSSSQKREVVEWCTDNFVESSFIQRFISLRNNFGKNKIFDLGKEEEKEDNESVDLNGAIADLGKRMMEKRISFCPALNYRISIMQNGDVYPCSFLPLKVGNIFEQSIDEIWNGKSLKSFRNNGVSKLSGKCSDCKNKIMCGGCRARAYAYSGDWFGSDPDCGFYEDIGC